MRSRVMAVNVGTVSGGTGVNVVAAECHASVDVRVATLGDGRWIRDHIMALEPTTPGTRLEIEVVLDRGPMEVTPRNRILWEAVQGCGKRLGLELKGAESGGASDGNTASLFTATVDGLRAVGHGTHAHNEHVRVSELLERTTLLALILMMPAMEAWGGFAPVGARNTAPVTGCHFGTSRLTTDTYDLDPCD